jgi:hypothetical protein
MKKSLVMIAVLVSGAAHAEMVTMQWPGDLLAAKRAEAQAADAALAMAMTSGDPIKIAIEQQVVKSVGAAYHFHIIAPTGDPVTVPDFEAKALAKQGFVAANGKDYSGLDVRAALQAAPYAELVSFLTSRGIGRRLFAWYAHNGNQMSIDYVRAMALAEFDKDPE